MNRFIKNTIRNGVSRGISDAIGKAVEQAVAPRATDMANRAAERIDRVAGNASRQVSSTISPLESAFSNLERSLQGYATELGKNMKVCPKCGQPTSADKHFCPACGEKLPEESLAAGTLCPECGTQNGLAVRFCENCGAKLPFTVQAEQEQMKKDEEVMAQWQQLLGSYPQWRCGGSDYNIESFEPGQFMFAASFSGDNRAAQYAVEQYRQLMEQSGFRPAGQYPSREHLYRMVGGVCRHVDTEHCFDGDSDCPTIYFSNDEPYGGFDYVKPEPKKNVGLKDLFRF